MDKGRFSISADVLHQRIGAAAPIIIDARRAPAFDADERMIFGAIRSPPDEIGDKRLVNAWAADHTTTLAGGQPTLALDMYEHAYHVDYGAKAGDYVDAFMQALRWSNAGGLYEHYRRARKPAYPSSEALLRASAF